MTMNVTVHVIGRADAVYSDGSVYKCRIERFADGETHFGVLRSGEQTIILGTREQVRKLVDHLLVLYPDLPEDRSKTSD